MNTFGIVYGIGAFLVIAVPTLGLLFDRRQS